MSTGSSLTTLGNCGRRNQCSSFEDTIRTTTLSADIWTCRKVLIVKPNAKESGSVDCRWSPLQDLETGKSITLEIFDITFVNNFFSYIFEAPKPTIPSVESNLRILEKTQTSGNHWRYTFLLTCPNNCAIYLSPTSGVVFGRWSLFPENNFSPTLYSSNYINLHLENRPDLEFTLDITLPSSTDLVTVLRAGVQSQYTAHRDNYAQEYEDLLSQFPRWTTTNDCITTFKSYEF